MNGNWFVDIIVVNIGQPNRLLHNMGDTTFQSNPCSSPEDISYTEAIAVGMNEDGEVDFITIRSLGHLNQFLPWNK